ncbi:MAG: peptidylprolyl isomerase [Chitinophagales bacterium]|nr:peptidylprolyl isomerase [Chitinophagales bacterium]MDW8272738.1 peptidylprolyl isomerase [Chitinophagales bacterium]
MQASPDSVVKITYQLRIKPDGEIIDQATADDPFSFLFGHANVLPKFEEYLFGKKAGEQFSFVLTPEEGYGEFDSDGIIQLSKEAFVWDGKLQEDLLEINNIIPLQDEYGNTLQGRITEIHEDKVTIDLNHPLAGKELYFTGQVIEVRPASPSELQHGHVHEAGHELH